MKGCGYSVWFAVACWLAASCSGVVQKAHDATSDDQSGGAQVSGGGSSQGGADGNASESSICDVAGNNVQLATMSCSKEAPPPPGPPACPHSSTLMPLPDGCTDAVCHVAIRLDHMTLGVLGWQVVGGGTTAVDADAGDQVIAIDANGANEIAQALFATANYPFTDTMVTGPQAGVFSAYVPATDFGAFALVGEESGIAIAAGGIVYSGQGDYWTPTTWRPASDINCGDRAATPTETFIDPRSCDATHSSPPMESKDALELALSSNLAAYVDSQGLFSAYVYTYTPAVGVCDFGAAEYLVILTQVRQ